MRQRNIYIINPASGFKKTKKNQKNIIRAIKDIDINAEILITHHPLHATSLAKKAILNGVDRIIAIGGDGTLNEALNGFFDIDDKLYSNNAILAQVASGTGADFVRNFEHSDDICLAIKEAITKEPRLTDIGIVKGHDTQGQKIKRYFINASSLGISGLVAGLMRQTTRSFGGRVAYFMATVRAIRQFTATTLIIKNEAGEENTVDNCYLATFANGQYIGSGMHIAPNASLDDGLFDEIMIKDLSVGFFITNGYRVYLGTHLDLPNVSYKKGKEFFVASLGKNAIFIETDGELFGQLPASFKILPKKLWVVR